jgi:hypothetical protein
VAQPPFALLLLLLGPQAAEHNNMILVTKTCK